MKNPFWMLAFLLETGQLEFKGSSTGYGVESDFYRLASCYDSNPVFRWYVNRNMPNFVKDIL